MMVENILSQGAGITSTLKETAATGASLQGSVNQVAGQVMGGMRDVEIMNSKFKDSAKVDYARGLMEMAQYKDKQWDYNVNQPHIQEMTKYLNDQMAGDANLFGGLTNMADYAFQNNIYKKYYGDSVSGGSGAGAGGTVPPWYTMGNGGIQNGYTFGSTTLPIGANPGDYDLINGKYYKKPGK